jgi:hypothetical protein
MVQSNYTVSTAAQLLGRLPAARSSSIRPKSTTPRFSTLSRPEPDAYTDRTLAPSKALPPTPTTSLGPTVKVRASRSSDVLGFTDTDSVKTRSTDLPAVTTEDEVLTLPATVYTPTTPKATPSHSTSTPTSTSPPTLAPPVFKPVRVPVLEAPRKGHRKDSTGAGLEKRISQYYEYITPPVSLMGSCRERTASHTPTNSAGSVDIYFSPIDAPGLEAFLSGPQPSPDIEENVLVEGVAGMVVEDAPEPLTAKRVEMVEIAGIGRVIDGRKVTLTLAHVDRITTALARAPLVQMRVRGTHLDVLPENMTNTSSDTTTTTRPPRSETSPSTTTTVTTSTLTPDSTSTISLLDPLATGVPITHTSSPSPSAGAEVGTCTHLSLPYGLSTLSLLRIDPSPNPDLTESRILLQTLYATLDRKTHARSLTLIAETDVTHSFARAALTELAAKQNLSLDDLEIRTPVAPYNPDESVDWCNLEPAETSPSNPYVTTTMTSPVTDILAESLNCFNSPTQLNAESCTMQTLTLLSELSRLQRANETFLVLQPTRYDAKGGVAGVKIPLISEGLRLRFEKMGDSTASSASIPSSSETETETETEAEGVKKTFAQHAAAAAAKSQAAVARSTSSSSVLAVNHGGSKGRLFREAVIAAVVPRFVFGEEFETGVVLEGGKGKVRARCVPLFGAGEDERAEKWVCFFGGRGDLIEM